MKMQRMLILASNTFCWQTANELMITLERMREDGTLYDIDDPTFNEVSYKSIVLTLRTLVDRKTLIKRRVKNCRLAGCQPNKHEYVRNPNIRIAK